MGLARLFLWGLLFYGLWKMAKHFFTLRERLRSTASQTEPGVDDVLVKDPVCGAMVPKGQAVIHRSWGKTTYFCSEACRDKKFG